MVRKLYSNITSNILPWHFTKASLQSLCYIDIHSILFNGGVLQGSPYNRFLFARTTHFHSVEQVLTPSFAQIIYQWHMVYSLTWSRHGITTTFALLALSEGYLMVNHGFSSLWASNTGLYFVVVNLNKLLNWQLSWRWFEMFNVHVTSVWCILHTVYFF